MIHRCALLTIQVASDSHLAGILCNFIVGGLHDVPCSARKCRRSASKQPLLSSVCHTRPVKHSALGMISGFRRGVNQICSRLGFYATYNGSFIPTFRDSLSVPSSRVQQSFFLDCLTFVPKRRYETTILRCVPVTCFSLSHVSRPFHAALFDHPNNTG